MSPSRTWSKARRGDHAAAYSGPGDIEKLRQGNEVEAIYDFTDRWELVAKGLFLEPVGEPLEAKNYQLGLHHELVQRHGEGFAPAFRHNLWCSDPHLD
jgi:hypothetical protein